MGIRVELPLLGFVKKNDAKTFYASHCVQTLMNILHAMRIKTTIPVYACAMHLIVPCVRGMLACDASVHEHLRCTSNTSAVQEPAS